MLTQLIKGCRGFGFNIVGGSKPRELLQIYSVTANGPADLKTGRMNELMMDGMHGKVRVNKLLGNRSEKKGEELERKKPLIGTF